MADAVDLIKWYRDIESANNGVTWAVAENLRYYSSFRYARQRIEQMGRIIGFRVRIYANVKEDWNFFRKPTKSYPSCYFPKF